MERGADPIRGPKETWIEFTGARALTILPEWAINVLIFLTGRSGSGEPGALPGCIPRTRGHVRSQKERAAARIPPEPALRTCRGGRSDISLAHSNMTFRLTAAPGRSGWPSFSGVSIIY